DSCGGSQIICFSGDSVISGLKADSNYYLRYASSQNLAQEDSFFIQAMETVGIEDDLSNQLILYPNPASNQLYFSLPAPQGNTIQLMLFDSAGRLISRRGLSTQMANQRYSIPIEALPVGLYYLRLATDQGSYTGKFVKQ
ncbi:MAG: T9SS type A sorting domain-containing protein, partial [Bacteroidia bacterium]